MAKKNDKQQRLFDWGEDMGALSPEARYAQQKWEIEYMLKFWHDRLENGNPERRELYQDHIAYWQERKNRL